MAKLEKPLSLEEFQELKGVVDFYYWKGILCARKFPEYIKQPGTPAQKATWKSFKDRWIDFKKLNYSVAQGYKLLAGGSDLTWVDVFTKSYLKGWHIGNKPPAVITDLHFSRLSGSLNICLTATENTILKIHTATIVKGKAQRPWVWVTELPTPAPPNCSLKWTVLYTWEREYAQPYETRGSELCFDTESVGPEKQLYFQVVCHSQANGKEVFRTGVYKLNSM